MSLPAAPTAKQPRQEVSGSCPEESSEKEPESALHPLVRAFGRSCATSSTACRNFTYASGRSTAGRGGGVRASCGPVRATFQRPLAVSSGKPKARKEATTRPNLAQRRGLRLS
jgi:hypothetical protein